MLLSATAIYQHRRKVIEALRAGTAPPELPDTRQTQSIWAPIQKSVAEALAAVNARRARLSAQAQAPAPAPVALSAESIYSARRAAVAALTAQVSPTSSPPPAAAAESRRLSPDEIYAARRKAMNATPAPRAFTPALIDEEADEEATA